MLAPIVVTIFIAISIAAIVKWLTKSEMQSFRSKLDRFALLPAKDAVANVLQLIGSGQLRSKAATKVSFTADSAFRLGDLNQDFVAKFSEVRGEGFSFFTPTQRKRIGQDDYVVVGSANDYSTTFLLREGSDTVFVYDEEDVEVDSQMKFSSIWHAILFEASPTLCQ